MTASRLQEPNFIALFVEAGANREKEASCTSRPRSTAALPLGGTTAARPRVVGPLRRAGGAGVDINHTPPQMEPSFYTKIGVPVPVGFFKIPVMILIKQLIWRILGLVYESANLLLENIYWIIEITAAQTLGLVEHNYIYIKMILVACFCQNKMYSCT